MMTREFWKKSLLLQRNTHVRSAAVYCPFQRNTDVRSAAVYCPFLLQQHPIMSCMSNIVKSQVRQPHSVARCQLWQRWVPCSQCRRPSCSSSCHLRDSLCANFPLRCIHGFHSGRNCGYISSNAKQSRTISKSAEVPYVLSKQESVHSIRHLSGRVHYHKNDHNWFSGIQGQRSVHSLINHQRIGWMCKSVIRNQIDTEPRRSYIKRIELSNEEDFVNEAGIKQFLTENEILFDTGFTSFITQCPKNKRKLKPSSLDCLYINMKTGYFVCHSCKKSGSWQALQDNIKLLMAHLREKKRNKKQFECFVDIEDEVKTHAVRLAHMWQNTSGFDSVLSQQAEPLMHGLSIQKLHQSFLRKYEVRMSSGFDSVLLPYYDVDNSLLGIKTVSMKDSRGTKQKMIVKTTPRSDLGSVFGWNTITPSMTEVVLTANEFDAVAVNQETKLPALALPKGDSILPQQVLPLLEQFKKIILWFGNDVRSWEMAKQFSKKLNEKRCYLIRPGEDKPNALTALEQGLTFMKIVRGGRPVLHESITSFSQMRLELYSHFAQGERVAGVKWKRFPQLNNLLKGFRRGELTVFTGPTGAGKTTFISDYALDLCMQGVNTLWGSFEINNIRLLSTIMCQFAQMDLMRNIDQFNSWADQFEQLSMYFMNFHGQESINKVIETMSHAVYVHDIAHVIVDNLQFMMGVEMYGNSDRFLKQDSIVSAFRRFATQMNCHVTLVIHPRKERDSEDLTVASVFGSAKATQEADNVLILQDKRLTEFRGRKYVQIAKNRFDGELGVMLLKFDKSSMSFANKDKKKTSKKKADAALDSDPLDDDDMSTDVLADVTGKESALMEGENAENIDDDGNTVA